MGRRPNALAAKREVDGVDVKAVVLNPTVNKLSKPEAVAIHPAMSEYWDLVCGDGAGFMPEDSQTLQQLVFDYALADECRAHLINEDGTFNLYIATYDNDGFPKQIENPYYRRLRETTQEILKLSGEMGLTPMSRARLGLTKASANAVNISIAETVMKALKQDV